MCTNISLATFSWVKRLRTSVSIDFRTEKERPTGLEDGAMQAAALPSSRGSVEEFPYNTDHPRGSQVEAIISATSTASPRTRTANAPFATVPEKLAYVVNCFLSSTIRCSSLIFSSWAAEKTCGERTKRVRPASKSLSITPVRSEA